MERRSMTYEDVKKIRENPTVAIADNDEFSKMIDEAVEKKIGKYVKCYEDKYMHCPNCDEFLGYKWIKYPIKKNDALLNFNFCWECSQKLDWSEL